MNRKTFVATLVQSAGLQAQLNELAGLLAPDFSYYMKTCREASSLTLKEAAERINHDPSWIAQREAGHTAWNPKDGLTCMKAWAKPALNPSRLRPGPRPMSAEEKKQKRKNRANEFNNGKSGSGSGAGITYLSAGWSGNSA